MKTESIETLRRATRDEAASWLNTPYRHNARVKGQGVDCIQFVCGVAENVGLVDKIITPFYAAQWHLHQEGRQLLLDEVKKYCEQVDEPTTGDVVLFWYGHAYSHSALVMSWPECIHASLATRIVELIDAERDEHLSRCKRMFWRPRALMEKQS